jgi:hypothetical protein
MNQIRSIFKGVKVDFFQKEKKKVLISWALCGLSEHLHHENCGPVARDNRGTFTRN